MCWWQSNSGIEFQKILKTKASTFEDALTFIFAKTRINPNVVEKWKKGGNPSIKNIDIILDACGCINKFPIINGLREFKSGKREEVLPALLTAIITEDTNSDKYWVRTYHNNRFVYGDRTSIHNYASKLINTPKYRKGIIDKLGHNNFQISLDLNLSCRP